MEIILLERVENLGQMGDLVTVKPGYARNFLLPKGKAIRATSENRSKFDADRVQLEAENLAKKSDAEKVAKTMEGLSVTLIRAASEMGQLYGSASSRDIATAVTDSGFTVTKSQVDLNTAVKTLGIFPVRIVLHPEVSVEIKVNIARSEDEAAEQLRLGRAIISDTAEREREEAEAAAAAAEARVAAMDDEEADTTDAKAKAKSSKEAENVEGEVGEAEEADATDAKAKAKAKSKAKSSKKAKNIEGEADKAEAGESDAIDAEAKPEPSQDAENVEAEAGEENT